MKATKKSPRKYISIQTNILYCELAPLTRDVTCLKFRDTEKNLKDELTGAVSILEELEAQLVDKSCQIVKLSSYHK